MQISQTRICAVAGSALFFGAACLTFITGSRPALADAPIVPWSQIEGNSAPLRRNLPVGFYVYRKGNELYVVSHGAKQRGLIFMGRIVVEGGTIVNPKPIVLERDQNDMFQQQTPNVLDFKMTTYAKVDGVRFKVRGGQRVILDVRLEGQNTERVFFGPKPVQVVGSPIICDLSR